MSEKKMSKKNIVSKGEHLFYEFRSFLKDQKIKIKKIKHYTILNDDLKKDCFKKISDLISPYTLSKKEDCLIIIKQLVELIPHYSKSHKTRENVLFENLYYRAAIGEYEQTVFWHLSQNLISIWWDITHRERLNYYQSQILLACFWCHKFYNSFKKADSPFVRIGEIEELTKFSQDTVKKYLADLSDRGLIKVSISNKKPEYSMKSFPKSSQIFKYNKDPFLGDICTNIDFDDINLIRYIYSSNYNRSNPFLYIKPNGDIVVNRKILNMEFVIASILSEDELKNLLLISHAKRSISYTVKSIRQNLHEYIDNIKSTKPPIDLPPHFQQIYEILPLDDYVGRRHFEIDFDKLQHLTFYYKYRTKIAKDRFLMIYKEFNNLDPVHFGWDFEYLFECLGKNDSEEEWLKKYKIKDIRLMPLALGASLKDIQISEKNIHFRTMNEFVEHFGSCPVEDDYIRIDTLKEKPLKKTCNTAWGGQELFDYYVTNNALNNLLQIENNINKNRGVSIISAPSIFNNPTHRIYMENVSSQNTAKMNRPIVRAKKGHQFLMIDIRQMELELIKWYIQKEYKYDKIKDLTFETIGEEIKVDRSTVKDMFYPWSYGAEKPTILDESDATEDEADRFINYTEKTIIFDFQQEIEKEICGNYVTRETPLGFRIPIFSGARKGLVYLIQSAGAELFLRWLQKIHDAKLSVFIVNVIHDEVIFEIPVSYNIYDFTRKVKECLNKASKELFGELTFDTKQFASKYWDEKSAAEIVIN